MVESLLLVEGTDVSEEKLRQESLGNAKQLVYGRFGAGVVLHVAATTAMDLEKAILQFSRGGGVTSVITLAFRTSR